MPTRVCAERSFTLNLLLAEGRGVSAAVKLHSQARGQRGYTPLSEPQASL